MGFLRLAKTDTKRIELPEGDWIDVRADISKRDFNRLISFMPDREVSEEAGLLPAEAMEFQKGLFEALVVGWSADVPPTIDNYLALSNDAGQEIDRLLAEHFASLTPTRAEGNAPKTSPASTRKG